MASYAGYYYGEEIVMVSESEYYQDPYISRCKILERRMNPLKAEPEVFLRRREYEEVLRYKQACMQQMVYSPMMDTQYSNATAYNSSQAPVTTPKEKKSEKASKQIRHQFLRRRLLDKINK